LECEKCIAKGYTYYKFVASPQEYMCAEGFFVLPLGYNLVDKVKPLENCTDIETRPYPVSVSWEKDLMVDLIYSKLRRGRNATRTSDKQEEISCGQTILIVFVIFMEILFAIAFYAAIVSRRLRQIRMEMER
jgi:hypothetical protein